MSVRLLIDAGNTRLKWALWDGVRLYRHGQAVHGGPEDRDLREAAVAGAMDAARRPAAIVVGNVAGDGMARALDSAALARHSLHCVFVTVVAEAFGVRVAYRHPRRLGVDRWLAMLAARDLVPGPSLIVDAGTALTVDALAADGTHLGGLIAPGVDLMRRSLLDSTARIGDGGLGGSDAAPPLFAADTGDAVTAGAIHGNAALVDRAAGAMASMLGVQPRVLLTGGAAGHVGPAVSTPLERVDDLVLKGLAQVAGRSDDGGDGS